MKSKNDGLLRMPALKGLSYGFWTLTDKLTAVIR